jgi:DNA-directed RNA polymerase specialized sigma24 family protein
MKKSPTLPPTLIWIAFSDNSPRARAALSILYETYREPIRAYIRRWRYAGGYDVDQADELMQRFFERLTDKLDLVKNWDPKRTRFRSWLFASVNYFLLNDLDCRARERLHVSYEDVLHAPSDSRTPERMLAVQWARDWVTVLIDGAFAALRAEYERTDRLVLYDALSQYLGLAASRSEEPPYAKLSERLGRPPGTLRSDMSRMRRYWKRVIWELVRQTVPADQVRSEIELLISVLESEYECSLPLPPARHRASTSRTDPPPPTLTRSKVGEEHPSEWMQ